MFHLRLTFFVTILLAPGTLCAQASPDLTCFAFGSCSQQDSVQLWKQVIQQKPSLFVWLGDNIYMDTHDDAKRRVAYAVQKNNPDYQQLRTKVAMLGTWDDHDYGQNDGGKNYSGKQTSKEALLDFLDVPASDPVRTHEGMYSSHTYGSGTNKVKIILLDTRWFRDTLVRSSVKGRRYEVNPDGDILGAAQWNWLEEEFRSNDAALTFIGSSIQFLANDHFYEKWGNFPKARQRMLDLLVRYQVKRPIFLSGDRHMAEFSKLDLKGLPDPVWDFTSSGLTHTWPSNASPETNQYRVGNMVIKKNFGIIRIDWKSPRPEVIMEVHGWSSTPYSVAVVK